jgi:hypothetical protein
VVDVYRSSGKGGQGVNTTDSAVRIHHLPTGMIVTCQDERSQIKNRAKAMKVLRSRLLDLKIQKEAAERSRARKLQVSSGDRSAKIRTYNFPQGRVTDHRIGLTLYRIDAVMEGEIDELIDGMAQADAADRLREAGIGDGAPAPVSPAARTTTHDRARGARGRRASARRGGNRKRPGRGGNAPRPPAFLQPLRALPARCRGVRHRRGAHARAVAPAPRGRRADPVRARRGALPRPPARGRPGCFIPRPETELLVDETLAFLGECRNPRVLECCTGSGRSAVAGDRAQRCHGRHDRALAARAGVRRPEPVAAAAAVQARTSSSAATWRARCAGRSTP